MGPFHALHLLFHGLGVLLSTESRTPHQGNRPTTSRILGAPFNFTIMGPYAFVQIRSPPRIEGPVSTAYHVGVKFFFHFTHQLELVLRQQTGSPLVLLAHPAYLAVHD